MEDMPLDDYMDVSGDDHEIEGMLSKDYIDVLSDDFEKDGGMYNVCMLQEGNARKEISTITTATSEMKNWTWEGGHLTEDYLIETKSFNSSKPIKKFVSIKSASSSISIPVNLSTFESFVNSFKNNKMIFDSTYLLILNNFI